MYNLRKLMDQVIKFGLVGVIATIIDFGVLYISTDILNVNYLVSAAIGFILSTIFNYKASMKYVFKSKYKDARNKELSIFLSLSVIGLGINEVLLWLFVSLFHTHYLLGKLLATFFVLVFNFVSRKLLLEDKGGSTELK